MIHETSNRRDGTKFKMFYMYFLLYHTVKITFSYSSFEMD